MMIGTCTVASVSNMGSLVQEQPIIDAQLHPPTAHDEMVRWNCFSLTISELPGYMYNANGLLCIHCCRQSGFSEKR